MKLCKINICVQTFFRKIYRRKLICFILFVFIVFVLLIFICLSISGSLELTTEKPTKNQSKTWQNRTKFLAEMYLEHNRRLEEIFKIIDLDVEYTGKINKTGLLPL